MIDFIVVAGPNTCKTGYVWREADETDWVCVTAATRKEVADDNAATASRWVNGAYGPKTCINGYVWRGAFPKDYACVVKARRTAAAQDNAQAESRLLQKLA